jgi:hypothetical protein
MVKQTIMTDYFKVVKKQKIITYSFKIVKKQKKIYGFNKNTEEWHCLECGISMGSNNPRQFCRKTYCENNYIN